ncbi:unnamed protein product [Moneuplotes crassus]|uniref:Uncharacterized protein n=1 Tax=Euplotes crassus TaxID=5936 RepID=A0AAD1XHK7_EUPCR|nr:unnamed protein product [Moneuplotes crassus]
MNSICSEPISNEHNRDADGLDSSYQELDDNTSQKVQDLDEKASLSSSNELKICSPKQQKLMSLRISKNSEIRGQNFNCDKNDPNSAYIKDEQFFSTRGELLSPKSVSEAHRFNSNLDSLSTRRSFGGSSSSSSKRFLSPCNSEYTSALCKLSSKAMIKINKPKVYANTNIFKLDSRLLCESAKDNKINTMLVFNKGQLVRPVKHNMKHQSWAILNSDLKFCVKS